jgi:hypothetical protein
MADAWKNAHEGFLDIIGAEIDDEEFESVLPRPIRGHRSSAGCDGQQSIPPGESLDLLLLPPEMVSQVASFLSLDQCCAMRLTCRWEGREHVADLQCT